MVEVILIGDSIRIGYQSVAQKELEKSARLWCPEANGGTSTNILDHLDEWVLSRKPDIVHLNCGLHDIGKVFGAKQSQVPIKQYRANLEEILRRIMDQKSTRAIWATTTPVIEQWHHNVKGFDRFESDVEAYNQESREIADRLGVQVNDLFEVVMCAGRENCLQKDGAHFTDAGYELLGKAVAEAIRASGELQEHTR